jgi:hypothetical protein
LRFFKNAEFASRLNRLGASRHVDKLITPHAFSKAAQLVAGAANFFQ